LFITETLHSRINNTPLCHHHQHKDTLPDDILPVVRLLAALMQTSSEYTFPTSSALTHALDELSHSIESEDALHDKLHNVFLALWKTMWHMNKDNCMPDPTCCFLSLSALKPGGDFCQPNSLLFVKFTD
jgi:hypothetical protein